MSIFGKSKIFKNCPTIQNKIAMASFVTSNFENSTSTEPCNILSEVAAIKDEIVENRRWFHMYPEVAFEEKLTAAHVVELLKSYGITEIFEGVGGQTGVVALIRGAQPGPCILLRADMDALPIGETADIPHRSKHANCMHACGHDGHMSGLLAVSKVLNSESSRAAMKGTVKLLFQPAEER